MQLRIVKAEAADHPNLGRGRTNTVSPGVDWSAEVKLCSDPKQLIAEKYK